MALEWLSSLFDGLRLFLGGSNTRSIWSHGRGSISENVFQDSQLRKFEPANTFNLITENYNTQMQLLSNFSHANEAVKRLNQQRQTDISYLGSEIETLRGITIPDPEYIDYMQVIRSKSKRAFRQPAYSVVNPELFSIYQNQVSEFQAYKSNALETISKQLGFLTTKRDLFTSNPFSL